MFNPVVLDTEHVKIRPLNVVSWETLAKGLLYENSFHARNWGVKTPQDVQRMYEKSLLALQNKKGNPIVFLNRDESEVLGMTNFMNVEPENMMIEIGGTWINPKYQKTYVNTETKFALLQYAFETLHLVRVEFRIDSENFPSQKAVERLGFHRDGLMPRRKINANQDVRDYFFYSVTDQTWSHVKQRMLALLQESKASEYSSLRQIKDLLKNKKADDAFTETKNALKTFPLSASLHYLAACICDGYRTENEAVDYYLKSLELGLTGFEKRDAYLGLGSTYRSLGEYEKSAEIFTRGMQEFPDYRPYRVFLALTEYNLKKPAKSIERLLLELIETTNDLEIQGYQRALRFYSDKLDQTFD